MDENDNQSRFLLDTSIIVPIGIAAGVTLLVVAFVYCCRYFAHSKRVARAQMRTVSSNNNNNRPTVYVPPSGVGPGRSVPVQPRGTRGVAANMAAIQQYLPWSHTAGGGYQRNSRGHDRGQLYPPPSSTHHHRTNYNSTRVSGSVVE